MDAIARSIAEVFAIPSHIIGKDPNWNSRVERGDYLLAMSEAAGMTPPDDPDVIAAMWRRLERYGIRV